jgi:hypothetical protein
MDAWSLVADYLMHRNPVCAARQAGTQMACVSRMHREAVGMALRRVVLPPCGRPIRLTANRATVRFCLNCPGEFEVPTPTCRKDLFQAFSPCMNANLCGRSRMTYTLACTIGGRCVACGSLFERHVDDNVVLVALFVHRKDCAGCMPQPPQICQHCRVAFAY